MGLYIFSAVIMNDLKLKDDGEQKKYWLVMKF